MRRFLLLQKILLNTYKKFFRCLVTQTQKSELNLLQATAFGDTVQTYFLEANGDHDFLQFMLDRNQTFDEIIEAIQTKPKKVHLSAEVKLEKPASEDEDVSDLTINVNSEIETVYLGEKFTDDAFFTMLDQILSSLFSFTSHGSGWMLKDINGLYVKIVSYVPIRG